MTLSPQDAARAEKPAKLTKFEIEDYLPNLMVAAMPKSDKAALAKKAAARLRFLEQERDYMTRAVNALLGLSRCYGARRQDASEGLRDL